MILVDARCSILPERRNDFVEEVRKIIPAVRRECGCLRYELVADTSSPDIFHFIEEWESQRHLDDHLLAPHMQEYFAKTQRCHSAPTGVTIYEISASQSITLGD